MPLDRATPYNRSMRGGAEMRLGFVNPDLMRRIGEVDVRPRRRETATPRSGMTGSQPARSPSPNLEPTPTLTAKGRTGRTDVDTQRPIAGRAAIQITIASVVLLLGGCRYTSSSSNDVGIIGPGESSTVARSDDAHDNSAESSEPTDPPSTTHEPKSSKQSAKTALPTGTWEDDPEIEMGEPSRLAMPDKSVSLPAGWEYCEAGQFGLTSFAYQVVNIPVDDPDGGLVVHSGPGASEPVIGVLPPGRQGLITVGCAMMAAGESSLWWDVRDHGWVSSRYLATEGNDLGYEPALTHFERHEELEGIEAESVEMLINLVASALAAPAQYRAALLLVAPMGKDPGSTYIIVADIWGFEDDAIAGARLRLRVRVNAPDDQELSSTGHLSLAHYQVDTADLAMICTRGSTGDRCI